MSLRPMSSIALVILLAACTATREPATTAQPVAAAPTSVDWSKAKRVDVVLENFEFVPAHLTLAQGQPYRLHLKNAADGGHNFDAPAFFRSVGLRDDPTDLALKAAGGVVEVPGKGETDIYFVPARTGRFALKCSHFLHASFGMEGEIVVN